MPEHLITVMQLVGSLFLYGAAITAIVWYAFLWPFDRANRW